MSTVKRQIVEVPFDQLNGVDRQFGRIAGMDVEKKPAKFLTAFEQTKAASCERFKMKAVFESYGIESIRGASIRLENGVILESELLSEIFGKSFELIFIVVTLSGYEELDGAEENMFRKFFLDSWGTAFVECGNLWVEQSIAMELENKGLYVTHSFSPGQNDIPMEMQELIFQTLKPRELGVTLSEKYMMHPKKSVSGILGIEKEKSENRIRPCDICPRRDTCSSAYV